MLGRPQGVWPCSPGLVSRGLHLAPSPIETSRPHFAVLPHLHSTFSGSGSLLSVFNHARYDAFGKLTGEYTNFAGAAPLCGTCYLSKDHLGNTRLVTDAGMNVVARHDFLPFGSEIPAGYAGRDSRWGVSDAVNQKFTGQERDAESGFDYFGARYYGSALGRWASPDHLNLTKTRLLHPERLNKYSYAANNPLAYIDHDGLDVTALFEPPSGFLAGHFMLYANNPKTGDSALMSFGPTDTSMGGHIITALNGPQASTSNYGLPLTADQLRNNYAALTIQTTPEEAQKVIDAIKSFDHSTTLYTVFGTNCTTVCRNFLKDLGIIPPDNGDLAPSQLWSTLFYSQYLKTPAIKASYMKLGGLIPPPPVPTTPGKDYGNPRYEIDPFDFIRLSTCQDTWDPNTNTLHGCL